MTLNLRKLSLFLVIALIVLLYLPVSAQTVVPIECGDIVEAELTQNNARHTYEVSAPAGTTLHGRIEPIGNTLNSTVQLLDAAGNQIAWFNNNIQGVVEEFSLITSTSNPFIRIWGVRTNSTVSRSNYDGAQVGSTLGAYTILLGCTLRDGTVIEPGQTATEPTPIPDAITPPQSSITFSGTGFPGLAPVDFANAFKLPLSLGTPMPGSIPPSGDAILGLTFDASAGDTFALDFGRTSGNLNLGVVVLSDNNEVVFQASLVTSQSLSTRLTLPSAGQYTIGVFRIDLLPPAAPEATQFQITGTLNP